MTQRYTVELERINVYCATVEVLAGDIGEARALALARAKASPRETWEVNVGAPRVTRIIAHAREKQVNP